MRIGFIGLGKLGLPCAEEMARQHEVIGYDIEHRVSSHVEITQDIKQVFKDTEIIFVAVPTPHPTSWGWHTRLRWGARVLILPGQVSWAGMSVRDQLRVLSETDVFLTLPGSDAMNGVFLPDGALVILPCRLAAGWQKRRRDDSIEVLTKCILNGHHPLAVTNRLRCILIV